MFLTDKKIVYVPDINEENMDYEKIVQDLDLQNENIYEAGPLKGCRKRMRLHQLSWEEKLQRKKLRNRIAAQTSRDRKKAKMDHLEEAVKELKLQNEVLFLQVEELQKKNERLLNANTELQTALSKKSCTCICLTKDKIGERRNTSEGLSEVSAQICVKDDHSSVRPAVSSEIPQQKGQWTTLAQLLTKKTSLSLWKIFLLYLLSQKCWQVSRETHSLMTLKDWQQVCWKKLNCMKAEETQNLYSISGASQQECSFNNEMVGQASKMLESSGSKITSARKNQQHCFQSSDLTVNEQIFFILSEHSYAEPPKFSFSGEKLCTFKSSSNLKDHSIPTVIVSESERISEIENELKKDLELKESTNVSEKLDIPSFTNFYSPRSDISSDQGYDSLDSPYGSEISNSESFNDLWRDTFSELFPELI